MLTVNTAAGHRGPVLVGHGVVKASAEEGMEHRANAKAGNGRLKRRERLTFGPGHLEKVENPQQLSRFHIFEKM